MAINVRGSMYEDFFEYLQLERPEHYSKLMRHYSEKKASFPKMTERQYLLLMTEKIGKRERTKLESLDDNLISENDVKSLEKMIKESPGLKKVMQEYSDVQRLKTYVKLREKDSKKLEGEIVDRLRDNMDEKQKKQYSRKQVTSILPKLNLGPWRYRGKNYGIVKSIKEIIGKRRDLFENYKDIAVRILEAVYGQETQSARTFEDARRILEEI